MDDEMDIQKTDDGTQVEELDNGDVAVRLPEQVGSDLPKEVYNLVPLFKQSLDPDVRKFINEELPQRICEEFKEDWDSSEDWRNKRAKRIKLLFGYLDDKSFPFENCANVHVPVVLERVLRLAHRVYAELFPDKDILFRALPSVQLNQERADALTLHGNWQFRKEQPDFFKQNRRGLFEFFAHGDAVMHSFRDLAGGRNRHEILSCEEIVWPYMWKTSAVDMSDIPRKTRILRKYKHELLDLQDADTYCCIDEILEKSDDGSGNGSWADGLDYVVKDVIDKWEGKDRDSSTTSAPHTFLEYHGWAKLPGQKRERPILATVEYRTGICVNLCLREYEDWKDKIRFEKQSQEISQYVAGVGQYMQAKQVEDEVHQRLLMGDVPPDEEMHLRSHLIENQIQPPVQPDHMQTDPMGNPVPPEPARMIPIEQFSHGVCIENPDGSMGIGIGLLLEPFNEAADVMTSQFVDSATLANVTTLVMHENAKIEGGDRKIIPGEVIRVRGISMDQVGNSFKQITFPPANPQLMEMVKLQLESADGVSSAPDVLSGEAGKANETFRGLATRVEQATKQLSVLAGNYIEFLSQVMKNNARLNSQFMKDEEFLSVVDPRTMESVNLKLSRDLYLDDYEIEFSADTRFASKAQRISEADDVLNLAAKALPPPIMTMVFKPEFFREAVARCLKARGMYDMLPYLFTAQETNAKAMAPPPGPPGAGGPGGPGGLPAPGQPGIPGPGGQSPPNSVPVEAKPSQ